MSVLDSFRLDGRVAVVTGAGRGLGRAAARALAEAGADVALVVRDEAAGRVQADEIAAATGRRTAVAVADVTDVAAVEAAFTRVADELGAPSVLMNNAGIEHQGRLTDTEPADWSRVLDVNVVGSLTCARAFLRVGAPDGDRAIINVASIGAAAGVLGQVAYCASKGGIASATRALALELAPQSIRVNAIAPGYFATDMPLEVTADPDANARLMRRVPLRRLADPEEIGPLVVYLASRGSRFMTGETVYLDGGYVAQ
jgi:NAD(P)-dependent dehydrogenase (short-subunit alcohol dehydrogenase family)